MHTKVESVDKLRSANTNPSVATPIASAAAPALAVAATPNTVINIADMKIDAEASTMDTSQEGAYKEIKEAAEKIEKCLKDPNAPKVFSYAYQGNDDALKIILEGQGGPIIFSTTFSSTGLDLLALAVIGNKLSTVRYLLEYNAKLNPKNKITQKVLVAYITACSGWRNTQIISEFLNYGAPANLRLSSITPNHHGTALMSVASGGNSKAVQLLIDKGADILLGIEKNEKLGYGCVWCPAFYGATKSGDIHTVSVLLNKLEILGHTSAVDIKSVKSYLLYKICKLNLPKLFSYFIQREKQKIFTELDSSTYLISINERHDNLVSIIFQALKTYFNVESRKPYVKKLYISISSVGTTHMMEEFLNEFRGEVDINSYTHDEYSEVLSQLHKPEKFTALILAAFNENDDVLKFLVKKGANVDQCSTPNLCVSPLEAAIGQNVFNAKVKTEETVISMLHTLLSAGAKIVNDKKSALLYAYLVEKKYKSKAASASIKFFYLWKIATALSAASASAAARHGLSAEGLTANNGLDRKKLDELMKMPPVNSFINTLINTKAVIDTHGNLIANFVSTNMVAKATHFERIIISTKDITILIDRLHKGKYNLTQEPSKIDEIIRETLRNIHIESGDKDAVHSREVAEQIKSATAAQSTVNNMADTKRSAEASAMDISTEVIDKRTQRLFKRIEEDLRSAPEVFKDAYEGNTAAVKARLEDSDGANIFNSHANPVKATLVASDDDAEMPKLERKLHLDLLTAAVYGNKLDTLKYLLEHNTKQNSPNKITMNVIIAYFNACSTWGNTEIISEFLNYGVPVDGVPDGMRMSAYAQTPLMICTLKGNLKAVQLLIDRGANILLETGVPTNNINIPKHNAFYYAISSDNINILDALLNKLEILSSVQDVHIKKVKNKVLYEICTSNNLQLLRYFIQREKQKIFTELDATSYDVSVSMKKDRVVEIISQALKTYLHIHERKPYVKQLFHTIAAVGSSNMMEVFLNEFQSEVDINSYTGGERDGTLSELHQTEKLTALLLAAYREQVDILKVLVKRGANVNQLSVPLHCISPLEMAISQDKYRSEIITLPMLHTLLSAGAKIVNGEKSALYFAYTRYRKNKSNAALAAITFFYLWKIATALKISTASASAADISATGINAQPTTYNNLDREKIDELIMIPSISAFITTLINKEAQMDNNGNLYAPLFRIEKADGTDAAQAQYVIISNRDIVILIDRLHKDKYNLSQEPSKNDEIICKILRDIHIERGSKEIDEAKEAAELKKNTESVLATLEKVRQEIEAQNRENAAKNPVENPTAPTSAESTFTILFRVCNTCALNATHNPIAPADSRETHVDGSTTNKIDNKDGKKDDKNKDGTGAH